MTLKGDTGFDYVARCSGCNEIVGGMVDCDATKKHQAKEFAYWIKHGMYIERHPRAFLEEHGFGECRCAALAKEKAEQEKSAKDALQPSLFPLEAQS